MQIERNYTKAAQFVQDAAGRGAHLPVLPEYHLTNWVPHDAEFSDLCGQREIYLNSRVAVPFLEALGEETKNSSKEGMSVVDLDMKHVEKAEAVLNVRENLANEDWYYKNRRRAMTGREKL
ncbi:MAG: hypothetical protein Q9173_006166 [Seirophora scorigena]